MKRTWFAAGVLVGAMAVAGISGVALAQTPGPATSAPAATATSAPTMTPRQSYNSRLAQKLGAGEDKLTAAEKAALRDQQDERVTQMFAVAVRANKITQADADKYLAWWRSQPDTLPLGGAGHFAARGWHPGARANAPEAPGASSPMPFGQGQPPFGPGGRFGQGGPGFGVTLPLRAPQTPP